MNILLIGSGGREHALALSLAKSESCTKLYSYPGNPGIWKISERVIGELKSHIDYCNFCRNNYIELVVIGPEQPLADGLSDTLRQNGIAVFGPSKLAARLESSKSFAKNFMLKYNIPTASFKKFSKTEQNQAIEYLKENKFPVVIKADGLAAGKGVIIANDLTEAETSINQIFSGLFGDAGNTIVIEEFMEGEEASILAVTDGKNYILLPPSQDHKRILDGDRGKNTGGMGAYAPAPIVNDTVIDQIENEIIIPAINGMISEGTPFQGCLYAGLMIKDSRAKVVEFNVRFGDPETQAVLPLIEGDFAGLLYSAATGSLDKTKINISNAKHSCCVVLASEGYPDNFEKGYEILGIDDAENSGALIFHAGTSLKNDILVNSGGRVLGVTALGENLEQAISQAYFYVGLISYKNKYYRKDIGLKGLKKNSNRKFTILYDGECGICSASADWIVANDKKCLFNVIPFQNADFIGLPVGLTKDIAERSVILIDNEAKIFFRASRAVFEISRNLFGIYRIIGILGGNSFFSALSDPFYYLIARYRRRISIWLGFNACSVNYDKSAIR